MDERLAELARLGQSIWYDQLRRAMLGSGALHRLIDLGVTGITSNPTIFERAIAGSPDYDGSLRLLASKTLSVDEIYEQLVLEDIAEAADILYPVYESSGGLDGYVSLEVRPTLAADTEGSVAEARRLFYLLGRENVMIKVPATPPGIPAISTLIADGVNINITLIFSLKQYESVAEAYLIGLEKRLAGGERIDRVASVASFFISRVDTAVDAALGRLGVGDLKGKTAIANAKVAYDRSRQIFSGERWERLARNGGRPQRPLWASTGVKNPSYPDTLYVEELIGAGTVNTLPPSALNAFLDHGRVAPTLGQEMEAARSHLEAVDRLGIDLEAIAERLQAEGVEAFTRSFLALTNSVAEKLEKLRAGWRPFSFRLGSYQEKVAAVLGEMDRGSVMDRLWAHDHTLWKPGPVEIANRLGWLHIADAMQESLPRLADFAEKARADGYIRALLLGMGGSSLAPEVFSKTFGTRQGYLELAVLDTTDPDAILDQDEKLDISRTLFIVSTKSGTTIETSSLLKYFYNRAASELGAARAGEHFVAITDAGTQLEALARRHGFREIFLNDPNIGGRYAALSYVGLAPAALLGVDLERVLDRALRMACNNEGCNQPVDGENLGAKLGAILGELAQEGRDKLTLFLSPQIASFGHWVEQLIAESTGKEGRGIFPVVDEQIGPPQVYGDDRLFVQLKITGEDSQDAVVRRLEEVGHPAVRLTLEDISDLGGQFFLWEVATAIAGHRMGINPFDQPDVEAAKVLARQAVAAYERDGQLPEVEPTARLGGVEVFSVPGLLPQSPYSIRGILNAFLAQSRPGDYIAIQAYLNPTPEVNAALQTLRLALRDRIRLATSLGYGPRFLHSTGQLHKGDRGNGLFLQITAEPLRDVPIPDEMGSDHSTITFGTLKLAQALGDRQALLDGGRRVLRFHLGPDVTDGLRSLVDSVGGV